MILALLMTNTAFALDRDDDGLRNKLDACPRLAEDLDGWEDEDGCPEPTNVQIKVRDTDGYFYTSAPWALGEDIGQAGDERDLEAGEHTFWVEGYPSTVVVPEGPPASIYLEIPAPRGELAVRAVDIMGNLVEADFIADGPGRVGARCNRDVLIRPGTWQVRVTAPGYDPIHGRVWVREDDKITVLALMRPTTRDRDGDGVPDDIDYCPDQQEDVDGHEDTDGCPDGADVEP